MADDRNIQDFNRGVALVLGRLYAAFPTPIPIIIDDLDASADADTRRIYGDTVRFLAAEGLIRLQEQTLEGDFLNVMLAAKGLSLLQAVPEGLQAKKPWVAWLNETLKEGSRATLKTLMEILLRQVGGSL